MLVLLLLLLLLYGVLCRRCPCLIHSSVRSSRALTLSFLDSDTNINMNSRLVVKKVSWSFSVARQKRPASEFDENHSDKN